MVVCLFVAFHLSIVLVVLLRVTASDYPFGILKFFLTNNQNQLWQDNEEIK